MTIAVIIIRVKCLSLMMMTDMDIETSVDYVHLTRLIAREDYINIPLYSTQRPVSDFQQCLLNAGMVLATDDA
jgi:hypothetical protein